MKKKILLIIMCICLCLSLCACNSTQSLSEPKVDDNRKYSAYVEINNYMTDWLNTALVNYFETFGTKEEIAISKNFTEFYTFPILDDNIKDLDKALEYASKKPSYEVDNSFKKLYPKMKEMMNTLSEIESYYKTKDFEKDNFKKGKELHKKLIPQYTEYASLAEKFFSDFNIVSKQKEQEDLKMLKEEDFMLRYHALDILILSQDMLDILFSEQNDDNNSLIVDKYKEKYNLLSKSINKFKEYSKDDSRIVKEGFKNKPDMLKTFNNSLERMYDSATDIMHALEGNYDRLENKTKGKVTTHEGIPIEEDFNNKIFNMIDCYNNMI